MRRRRCSSQEKLLAALAKVEPEMLTTSDIATWLDVGIKLERQARGESDADEAAQSFYVAFWERLGGDLGS